MTTVYPMCYISTERIKAALAGFVPCWEVRYAEYWSEGWSHSSTHFDKAEAEIEVERLRNMYAERSFSEMEVWLHETAAPRPVAPPPEVVPTPTWDVLCATTDQTDAEAIVVSTHPDVYEANEVVLKFRASIPESLKGEVQFWTARSNVNN